MRRTNVRENLVDAGLREFQRVGFNACTIDDIVQAAGVPKGSFYNYFKGKEALAVAALDEYYARIPQFLLKDDGLEPLERLRNYFTVINTAIINSDYVHGCLLNGLATELSNNSEIIQPKLAALFDAWAVEVASVISAAQAKGEVSTKVDAKHLAGFIMGAYRDALVRCRVTSDRKPLDEFMDILFHQLLR